MGRLVEIADNTQLVAEVGYFLEFKGWIAYGRFIVLFRGVACNACVLYRMLISWENVDVLLDNATVIGVLSIEETCAHKAKEIQ